MRQFTLPTVLLLILAVALPAYAVEEHHPGPADAATGQPTEVTPAPAMQADPMKMDAAMMQMQDTRMKMQAATDPAEKKRLMSMHMQQMQEGMKMMGTMGMMASQDMGKMPMGGQNMKEKPMGAQEMSKMPANDRMAMMEEMMGPGGMMEKMMGPDGMMGKMEMMEKKMSMMMEMMNGMMDQQEMMMK